MTPDAVKAAREADDLIALFCEAAGFVFDPEAPSHVAKRAKLHAAVRRLLDESRAHADAMERERDKIATAATNLVADFDRLERLGAANRLTHEQERLLGLLRDALAVRKRPRPGGAL